MPTVMHTHTHTHTQKLQKSQVMNTSHSILNNFSNAYPCRTGRYLVELYKVMIVTFMHILIYCE